VAAETHPCSIDNPPHPRARRQAKIKQDAPLRSPVASVGCPPPMPPSFLLLPRPFLHASFLRALVLRHRFRPLLHPLQPLLLVQPSLVLRRFCFFLPNCACSCLSPWAETGRCVLRYLQGKWERPAFSPSSPPFLRPSLLLRRRLALCELMYIYAVFTTICSVPCRLALPPSSLPPKVAESLQEAGFSKGQAEVILQVVVAGMEESTLKSTAMVCRSGKEERMEGRREGGRGRALATAAFTQEVEGPSRVTHQSSYHSPL